MERSNMMKKYRVKRTVIITTSDVMYDVRDPKELADYLDTEVMSVAGEIGQLGLGNLHDSVTYRFGDTVVEEV